MRIILYRNGREGVIARLPGENVEQEMADLLGGETEMTPLNKRLTLVRLVKGEELRLPIRYKVEKLGYAPLIVAGDCAVLALDERGMVTDATLTDRFDASGYLTPVL